MQTHCQSYMYNLVVLIHYSLVSAYYNARSSVIIKKLGCMGKRLPGHSLNYAVIWGDIPKPGDLYSAASPIILLSENSVHNSAIREQQQSLNILSPSSLLYSSGCLSGCCNSIVPAPSWTVIVISGL